MSAIDREKTQEDLVQDAVTAEHDAATATKDDALVEMGKNSNAEMEESSPGVSAIEAKDSPIGEDELGSKQLSEKEANQGAVIQEVETTTQGDGDGDGDDEDLDETTESPEEDDIEKNKDGDRESAEEEDLEEKEKEPEEEAEEEETQPHMKDDDNDDDEEDDDDSDSASGIGKKHKAEAQSNSSLPPRPLKRARTAYFIFTDEKRPQVQAENPGEGVAVVARIMGQMWSKLSAEEKESYQEKAAQERDRVTKELEDWKAAGGVLVTDNSGDTLQKDPSALIFPLGRIRKICKLDPEVRGMSKEALLLITKMAELATCKLGQETVRVAQLQNRRKLLPEDVAHVCSHREQFLFLKDDVKDLVKDRVSKQEPKTAKKGDATREAAAVGSKSITSFFGVANK